MFTRPLAPPSVPPPSGGLGSNSNYVLSSTPQCDPITDLTVTIDITQDLVLKSSNSFFLDGYSLQLNCYSTAGSTDAWQQYIFVMLGPDLVATRLNGAINNYTVSEDALIDEIFLLINLPSTTLPTGYQLQIQLKNDANNNVVGARWIVNDLGVLPAPITHLTGYWLLDPRANPNAQYNTEQHINYIGVDGHVHERLHFATGDWSCNDLTLLSGNRMGPTINSALDAYADADSGQHVTYIGTDDHIHELYIVRNGQWVDNDLNLLSKGVSPVPSSPLDGYVDTDKGQHVNFIGTDGHVHELYITPHGHWVNNDLIHLSGNGIAPSRNSSLCGYLAQDNGQHVNFLGTDGHVHELYTHPNAQWINNDLTVLSGNGVPPAPNSPLWGYWGSNNSQHVNFVGTDGHVHELYIPSGGHWVNNDLIQLSGNGMAPAPNSALHSYAQPNGDQHVNFIGINDAHLHELFFRNGKRRVNYDLNFLQLVNVVKDPLDLSKGQFAPHLRLRAQPRRPLQLRQRRLLLRRGHLHLRRRRSAHGAEHNSCLRRLPTRNRRNGQQLLRHPGHRPEQHLHPALLHQHQCTRHPLPWARVQRHHPPHKTHRLSRLPGPPH